MVNTETPFSIGSNYVKKSSQDDSINLNKGNKLIVCYANQGEIDADETDTNIKGKASKLYVITYEDLYNTLIQDGKITNENSVWSTKVSYDPTTGEFSNISASSSAERAARVRITSSPVFNSDNTTYTDGDSMLELMNVDYTYYNGIHFDEISARDEELIKYEELAQNSEFSYFNYSVTGTGSR